ncbi:MAG: nitroreductase family protein [Phycisphaerae bacterium]|nr:nitroreductase family protein [Phycisphaerae bacterium]
MKCIFTRRSIRKYTDQPVPDEMLQEILKAAFVAPSAADERPWHFVVIRDRKTLAGMAKQMEGAEMLESATLGLLICGDPSLEKIPGYWPQDCSACAENVLLAAHAQGLGACWFAIYPIEDRMAIHRKALGIPDSIIPFALVTMGYPAEQLPGEDRYDASRLHHERW